MENNGTTENSNVDSNSTPPENNEETIEETVTSTQNNNNETVTSTLDNNNKTVTSTPNSNDKTDTSTPNNNKTVTSTQTNNNNNNSNKKNSNSNKKKKEIVSFEQREILLNFITENPEMITHSSTREAESSLWTELAEKINVLSPSKSKEFWKMFLRRWQNSLENKPDVGLTLIDCRLKNFMKRLCGGAEKRDSKCFRKQLTLREVSDKLQDVEAERMQLNLDLDELDYKVVRYKRNIKDIEKSIAEKRKRNRELISLKNFLHDKKRKIEERETKSSIIETEN